MQVFENDLVPEEFSDEMVPDIRQTPKNRQTMLDDKRSLTFNQINRNDKGINQSAESKSLQLNIEDYNL